ncbi:MAG: hypothetical protein CVU98_07560 [Firmicutes bacterium HGW-Firmicutes-3]|jgi:hypothetical protein|nr:MAG: hypothetical protein CVU98_07560 [Firmicutes bacterium HGW-Firmicutes-3]
MDKTLKKDISRFRTVISRFLIYTMMIIILVIIIMQTPVYPWTKSIVVMSIYSRYESGYSLLRDKNIQIKIPGGFQTKEKDWYPFVMTFNDDLGFSGFIGEPMRMTVLYNFGHFSPLKGYASYYDIDSPYYNSFYGAYGVSKASEEAFGFIDGKADHEAISKVPEFDMVRLVLESIGSYDNTFEYEVISEEKAELFNETDWLVIDAKIKVNGSMHTYKADHRAYIQYGKPPKVSPVVEDSVEDFAVIDMVGRIYVKHYKEKNITLFFYCITREDAVIEAWVIDIMDKTKLIMH